MKNKFNIVILPLFILTIFTISCANPTALKPTAHARAENSSENEQVKPPHMGMTKAQVRERYGRPVSINSTSSGEVWFYMIDRWDFRGAIPGYGIYHNLTKKNRSATISFGPNGRVRDYSWNENSVIGL
jgi:outer membrane protein assembly factor BamE (lipoprotein component of BamABCDE complex)